MPFWPHLRQLLQASTASHSWEERIQEFQNWVPWVHGVCSFFCVECLSIFITLSCFVLLEDLPIQLQNALEFLRKLPYYPQTLLKNARHVAPSQKWRSEVTLEVILGKIERSQSLQAFFATTDKAHTCLRSRRNLGGKSWLLFGRSDALSLHVTAPSVQVHCYRGLTEMATAPDMIVEACRCIAVGRNCKSVKCPLILPVR